MVLILAILFALFRDVRPPEERRTDGGDEALGDRAASDARFSRVVASRGYGWVVAGGTLPTVRSPIMLDETSSSMNG